jgi:methionine biosynthesis protein MetW
MADPDWRGGRYLIEGTRPAKGLAVARMAAHITYLSETALHRRFGRNLQNRAARTFSFDADFQVESYLRHQGTIFVERFDPNSYLYMSRAMDYFDLAADYGGSLANAFKGSRTRFCVVSSTSDWLFPTSDSRATVRALKPEGPLSRSVADGSRVLDVGCDDGELLRLLVEERNVDGRGIELSQQGVNDCVAKRLSVIQGDADTDLIDYPNDAFDYVILSQTLQATRQPRVVLEHMLPIGRRAIVSVPNFGHWRVRAHLALLGRMPVTESLSQSWYDTPNILFCTIADFIALAGEVGETIDKSAALDPQGRPLNRIWPKWAWNLLGEQAIFLLHRRR